MIRMLICSIVGHSINRNRVRFDGMDFRTTCRRCDRPMIREDAGWKRYNPKDHGGGSGNSRPDAPA